MKNNSLDKAHFGNTAPNKIMVYILAMGVFSIITTEFGVIGILPQIAEQFHVSITDAGWLVTAFALTIAIFGPLVTLAVSRVNRKIMLAIVLAVFVIANLLSMVATSFPLLLFARILPAFFHPIFFSVAMATAAGTAAPGDGPKAVSLVFSGVSIGTVLGVPLIAFFTDLFSWEAAFLISALINLITLLLLWKILPSMPVSHRLSMGKQLGILKKGATWWNAGITLLIIASMSVGYSYMAEYLKEVVKMGGRMISLTLLLFGTAGVFGNLLTGRLLSKNISFTVWIFLAGLTIIQGLLFLAEANFNQALILTIIWGFIHTGGFLLGQTLITNAAPEAPEFASSIFISVGNWGFSLGAMIGGIGIAQLGVGKLPVISILLLLVAVIVFAIREKSYGSSGSVKQHKTIHK